MRQKKKKKRYTVLCGYENGLIEYEEIEGRKKRERKLKLSKMKTKKTKIKTSVVESNENE